MHVPQSLAYPFAGRRLLRVPEFPQARVRMLLGAATVIAFGVAAVWLGQSSSWDLRNYHLYDGWAFWTGRGERDYAAAQLQSYFNPLLATFTYLLFTNTPAWLSALLLGLLQGANVLPLHAIARRLLPPPRTALGSWAPAAVALTGALGATQLGELGTSIGDNIVSLPLLCALALCLRRSDVGVLRAAGAGLLAGMTTGIKLTAAPFAVGLGVTLLVLVLRRRGAPRMLAAFAAAGLAGFLACDGFWLLHLYREFGNPLHPMFAQLFGGAYTTPLPLRDVRYLPHTQSEWLFYPLLWASAPRRVSEMWFLDLHVPLAFLTVQLLLIAHPAVDRRRETALVLGMIAAYVLWLRLFGAYRYLAPLEMVAPLLVVLALLRVARPLGPILATVAIVLMVAFVRPPDWGRLPEYGERYLEIAVPDVPGLDRATVLLAEDEPLAFLALGFPPRTAFVRIGGNLLGPPYPVDQMDRDAAQRIAAADGPLYALLDDPHSERVAAVLARQRLALETPCAPVRSNLTGRAAQMCAVRRDGVPDLH